MTAVASGTFCLLSAPVSAQDTDGHLSGLTKRGVEAAVLVPIGVWRQLEKRARPDLKELLLTPQARTDALTPPRPLHRHRASPSFE